MKLSSTAAQVISLFKTTLNKKSKWYSQDLADFTKVASTKTEKELSQQLANMRGIMGLDKKVNKMVDAYEQKLEKAGMYNMSNMKAINCLD